jgi:hypothetical protein
MPMQSTDLGYLFSARDADSPMSVEENRSAVRNKAMNILIIRVLQYIFSCELFKACQLMSVGSLTSATSILLPNNFKAYPDSWNLTFPNHPTVVKR